MPFKLVAEREIRIGEPFVIEGASPAPTFVVVFEDDGSTGYFYALDTSRSEDPIVDVMLIYNVASVSDRQLLCKIQLVWSPDHKKAALLINHYLHAVFDFEDRLGGCRTGFPPPSQSGWNRRGNEWMSKAEELFQ